MSRPKKPIDEKQVFELAKIGCTFEEMACVLDCSAKTLQRRFVQRIKAGRLVAKASLRKKQYEVAMKGSPAMLIWLGKQELGQRDKQEHSGANGGPIQTADVTDVDDSKLDERIERLQAAIDKLEGGTAPAPEDLGLQDGTSEAARGEAQAAGAH